MADITLTSNGSGNPSITIEAPDHPHEPGESSRQIVGRTWGGGFKIAKPAGTQTETRPRLHFRLYPDADYTSLRDFIVNDLNLHEESMTYVDFEGTSHTNMRYAAGLASFRSVANADPLHWNGTIELVKDLDP